MSSATGIRIDSLLHSLKELQNEKQCLEQKLNERRCQAQVLERRVDSCNAKLGQMREMHQKLSDMQKVAVQKVQQTQQQVDSLHELNQAQSNRINELNGLIQQEKDRSLKNVEAFEEKMSELAEKLIAARKFYKADTLQDQIRETSDKIRLSQVAAKTDSEEVTSLSSTMDSLQLTPPGCTLDQDVPNHTRLMIWKMLEEEEHQVTASLQRLQAEQQEICTLLQESICTPNNSLSVSGSVPPSQ